MFIPYSKQSINKEDIKAVTKALKDPLITQGDKVNKFEEALKQFTKSKYATVVNSATSALYIACRVLDIKKKDEIWTSSNTFVSTASVVIHSGGTIKFLDIDKNGNICLKDLKRKLINAKKIGKIPKAIITVHFSGYPCYPKEIFNLSKKYNFKIIEDASHALGAYYNQIPIGSCKHSDMCIFSFHAIKSITTGEGGCITTNNKLYDKRLKILRTHGIEKKKENLLRKKYSNLHWYYEVKDISFNFRLTDFQCALGISQLKRLKNFISKRENLAKRYLKKIDNKKFILPNHHPNLKSSWHLFVLRLKKNNRNKFYTYLKSKKILSVMHYIPVYMHPFFKYAIKNENLTNIKDYFKSAISIPLYPDLKQKDQDRIIKIINNFK